VCDVDHEDAVFGGGVGAPTIRGNGDMVHP
jgi:hypothetical protein